MNNKKVESFFRLNLSSLPTLTRITEKELEREIKNKGDQFRLEKEHENFILQRWCSLLHRGLYYCYFYRDTQREPLRRREAAVRK